MHCWYWLADACRDYDLPFVLGHAWARKAVHGSKTKCDRHDAEAIARLLRGGAFPLAYAYPKERRGLRDLLRARLRLVRPRAELYGHVPTARRPFPVVRDRHGIHNKARAVKAFLAEHPDGIAEDFPGYMPDLNPDEQAWGWTKYGCLSNLAAWDADELWDRVVDARIDLKFQPRLLQAFLRHAEIPVAA